MSTRSAVRRLVCPAYVLIAIALLTGCVRMPTDGPVEESPASASTEEFPGISFDPRPPRPGETPTEVVNGFLEAMRATPISLTTARQFLSSAARDTWSPEKQIITYDDLGTRRGTTTARISMSDVNLYDARGTWDRSVPQKELRLSLVEEDGQWRVDSLPDALVVPESWFDDWYQRVSLYFFDPTSEVLVPEPIFVPRGEQLASSLVSSLLAPVPDDERDVLRSWFPPGTTQGLMPVKSGIAEVSLTGDPEAFDEDTVARMRAQLEWTLRQDPDIRAVQLSIGGRSFGSTGVAGTSDPATAYDPDGRRTTAELFALDDGLLVRGELGRLEETIGPLGQEPSGARSIGVDVAGSQVAAVSADGTGLLVAQVDGPGSEVAEVLAGASDLQRPSWDYRERIWVLDRAAGRARVLVVVDGRAGEVTVPGVSGRDVREVLVSRDGTRLVALVRGPARDRVVTSRVRHDADGQVLGATVPRVLPLSGVDEPRIRDIGWRSPTAVSVLSYINDDLLAGVRTVSVDGSPGDLTPPDSTSRVRGPVRSLVSAPVEGGAVYALAGRQIADLSRPERSLADLPSGLASLTYVG